MSRKLLWFFTGMAVMALLSTGVYALATGAWKAIYVLEDEISVIVDRVLIHEPNFLYNDTTYLPIRAVSEAVGRNVRYDEIGKTAWIGVSPEEETWSDNAGILPLEDKSIVCYEGNPAFPDFGYYLGYYCRRSEIGKSNTHGVVQYHWTYDYTGEVIEKDDIDKYVEIICSAGYFENPNAIDARVFENENRHVISIDWIAPDWDKIDAGLPASLGCTVYFCNDVF